MKKILLSGGSGLLGSRLSSLLKSNNYHPAILSRSESDRDSGIYHWDPLAGKIDPDALEAASAIIHLAGAGIAEKAWTEDRKKEILESRVKSAALLFKSLKSAKHNIKVILSASAVGIYGDGADEWKTEESTIDEGFLQETCEAWEKSVQRFEELGIRVVIFRIGIVLAKERGALPQMALPVKLFAGAALGSGKQYMSWIHIDDLCKMFLFALENEKMQGVFNAVAPGPVTNKEFYKLLTKILKRPLWPFNVPAAMMKLLLGEKAEIVLHGQRVSDTKIRTTGFKFEHTELKEAIASLL